jgi:hypothetical protein
VNPDGAVGGNVARSEGILSTLGPVERMISLRTVHRRGLPSPLVSDPADMKRSDNKSDSPSLTSAPNLVRRRASTAVMKSSKSMRGGASSFESKSKGPFDGQFRHRTLAKIRPTRDASLSEPAMPLASPHSIQYEPTRNRW